MTEYVALVLGASDDGPAPWLTNDITRCMNDLKKSGHVSPIDTQLEGRVVPCASANCLGIVFLLAGIIISLTFRRLPGIN